MLVTFLNASAQPVFVSSLYVSIGPGLSVTTRRTNAELDADYGLKALVSAGTIALAFTKEEGDDLPLGESAAQTFSVSAPAAASPTVAHAGFAGNNASNAFPGPFTNPDVPRNGSVTFAGAWDGGNVTLTGTNQFDAAVSETFVSAPGTTVAGVKIFKTFTSAAKSAVGASATTASIGVGNKLGVSDKILSAASAILFVDNAAEPATLDLTWSAFTPTTVPDGLAKYLLIGNT